MRIQRGGCHTRHHSPPEDGVALAHVSQIVHELPHARVAGSHLVDVDGEKREARAAHEVRHVARVW